MEEDEIDQDGRYNISSTIDIQKGNKDQSYKCSLWILSVEKSSQEVSLAESQNSSGSMIKLQWIFLIVEIMIVKSMT